MEKQKEVRIFTYDFKAAKFIRNSIPEITFEYEYAEKLYKIMELPPNFEDNEKLLKGR
ncbi:MAG: hypothetical protein J7L34_02860 [Thermotogaceae bacterium]|nr:hypothetical protein [Thermotogaceae bacterium]